MGITGAIVRRPGHVFAAANRPGRTLTEVARGENGRDGSEFSSLVEHL